MAGSGSYGSGGDGGSAIYAQLSYSYGIATDDYETIFIADRNNNKIRKVTRAGIITTYAGMGTNGNIGDNGAAINAQLSNPQAVAFDSTTGSVYIADTGNGKIRIVTSGGIISTFTGSYSYANNQYNCPISSAAFYNPMAVAVDSVGNVYIGTGNPYDSSPGGRQVLFVASGSGYVTLLAGCNGYINCNSDYGGPAINFIMRACSGIAVDQNLNVYIATVYAYSSNNQVFLVTHATGLLTLFAGSSSGSPNYGDGGPAISATLGYPSGVGVDVSGNVYISDQQNNNVRRVANGTGIITTYAGGNYNGAPNLGDGGPASSAYLNYPNGLTVNSKGIVFVSDTNDCRVRKIASTFNYPTSQPSAWPSTPSSQPSQQPSNEPSKFVWYPKYEVRVCYVLAMHFLYVFLCLISVFCCFCQPQTYSL